NKRVEAIQVKLTGEISNHYDVYYRVYSQSFGWLGWAKNGESAGTSELSKRLEAVEIILVAKGGNPPGSTDKPFLTAPSVVYSTHVQTHGWLNNEVNGAISGTVGEGKRLEAIKINLKNSSYSGGISYSTHVQSYGWTNNVSNGEVSGTSGESKRLEAIEINLTGEIGNYFDVYYRVHIQGNGWLGWAENGMKAGSEGLAKRLEAIEIKLVPKGQGEPVSEKAAFKEPFIVFLDPGHGGIDTGAISGGYREKDLNLAVAKKVKSLLVNLGYNVIMSRNDDSTVELIDRPKMANDLQADIFVSIHTNATESGTTAASGIESYYYKYTPGYPPKINSAMHNDPVRIARSMALANILQQNMVNNTGSVNRGTNGETLAVVRESAMPATLVELGFINNPSERQKLFTDAYQNKLAKAIADGINHYFSIY
ncbi:N-acetylmuramoyl-L-alanine amidase, partial [Neobacillus jeddahensis]